MAWGAVAAMAANKASDWGSTLYNTYQNRKNYKHRHQWEVADLKKAGLNPILSATGGGAVAPSTGGGGQHIDPSQGSVSTTAKEQAKQAKINTKVLQAQAEARVTEAHNDMAVANAKGMAFADNYYSSPSSKKAVYLRMLLGDQIGSAGINSASRLASDLIPSFGKKGKKIPVPTKKVGK